MSLDDTVTPLCLTSPVKDSTPATPHTQWREVISQHLLKTYFKMTQTLLICFSPLALNWGRFQDPH